MSTRLPVKAKQKSPQSDTKVGKTRFPTPWTGGGTAHPRYKTSNLSQLTATVVLPWLHLLANKNMTKLLSNKIKQRPLTRRGRTKTKQKNGWVGCFLVGFLLKMCFEACSEQKVLPTNTSELELAQKDLWIKRSNQHNQQLGLHLRKSSQILEDFTSQTSQSSSRFIHPGLSAMPLFSPQVFGSFIQDKNLTPEFHSSLKATNLPFSSKRKVKGTRLLKPGLESKNVSISVSLVAKREGNSEGRLKVKVSVRWYS